MNIGTYQVVFIAALEKSWVYDKKDLVVLSFFYWKRYIYIVISYLCHIVPRNNTLLRWVTTLEAGWLG